LPVAGPAPGFFSGARGLIIDGRAPSTASAPEDDFTVILRNSERALVGQVFLKASSTAGGDGEIGLRNKFEVRNDAKGEGQ